LTNSFTIDDGDAPLAFEETSTRREMRSGGLEKRRVVREEAGDEFEPRFMTFCFKVREGSALSDDIFEFSEKS
jgi:hypothetical protein